MIYQALGFDIPLQQVPDHVTHLFGLVLNPMRGRSEEQRLLAVSESREELMAYWLAEKVEPYTDEDGGVSPSLEAYHPGPYRWHRSYRKGGPLEWFNPPHGDGDVDHYGCGIIELRRDGWRRVS